MSDAKRQELTSLMLAFQPACVLGAACELDLFTAILRRAAPPTVPELAAELKLDVRGLDALTTALVSLGLLTKSDAATFAVADGCARWLDSQSPETIVPLIRHQASCLRGWSQLAYAVKSGVPAPTISSVSGPLADNRSFILAMHSIGSRLAGPLVAKMKAAGLLDFTRFLDLGGASGTYSLEFLAQNPTAQGVILDLPIAIQEAKKRLVGTDAARRLELVEGDFYVDEYPTDVDFVWISAIIHQHDDAATAEMFRKTWRALRPGGRVAVRDIYVDSDRRGPLGAALFGVNMLAQTATGKVYSVAEVVKSLEEAGFRDARLAIPADDMTAVVVAEK